MNPSSWHQQFRVEYSEDASADLAAAVVAYFPTWQGNRVANAENIIQYLLSDDPERNGNHICEGLYQIVVSPLRIHYEIHVTNRVVLITSIGFLPV